MQTKPFSFLLSCVAASIVLSGCGSDTTPNSDTNSTQPTSFVTAVNAVYQFPAEVKSALLAPNATLSQELKNTLSHMGNEERLAFDIYNELYEIYPQRQLYNIANNSESVHIQAVQFLVQKYIGDYSEFSNVDSTELAYKETPISQMQTGVYDIQAIQDLYNTLYNKGKVSAKDALEVGCMVEVVDINDLTEYITLAEKSDADDIATVFGFLRQGSYQHYWAFDSALKTLGSTDGCCSGEEEYCHPEYPQPTQGHGNH